MSIPNEAQIPNPVAPTNPDAISAPALLYSPLIVLQVANAIPDKIPTIGIFFKVDFVRETLKLF
jgi:hypothetical protein